MDIALLNERITIQKAAVTVDAIGNHVNGWEDYYACHATVSGMTGGGQGGAQSEEAGTTVDHSELSFSVRWCARAAAVDATGYRILFAGDAYDIVSVDHMNFKRKSLKFKCRRVNR